MIKFYVISKLVWMKGSKCSEEGNNYEKRIYNILKNTKIHDKKFNTQQETELGGSTSKNDIECNYIEEGDVGIEIKKSNTPDWMQCSIKYDKAKKIWVPSMRGKIPEKCREIFKEIINNINLFDGETPSFMERKITHEEWLKIKSETNKWDDKYIYIDDDTIKRLYKEKGCAYIQISEYGLYHLGEDKCEFGVPEFILPQRLRIRTKIHTRKDRNGYCKMSVIIACQPTNIKLLQKSKYSLDTVEKLPNKLFIN